MGSEAHIWLLSLLIAAGFSAVRLRAQGLRWRWGRGWYLQLLAVAAIAGLGLATSVWPHGLAVLGWCGLLVPNLLALRLQGQLHHAVWAFDLAAAQRAQSRLRWVAHGPVRRLGAAKVDALRAALEGRHAEAEGPLLAFEVPDAPASLRRAAQATRLFVRLLARDLEGLVALAEAMEPGPGPASAEVAGLAARAYLELGRTFEALDWLARLRGDELNSVGVDLLGVPVFALLGAESDLDETFSRLGEKRLMPGIREFWRGRARAVLGDPLEARARFEEALVLLPDTLSEARRRVRMAISDLDAPNRISLTAPERLAAVSGVRVALARARRTSELVRGGKLGWLPKGLAAIVALPSLAVLAGLDGWLPQLAPWAERMWFAFQLDRRVQTSGEWWRLLSHMGLHAHLTHLALNLLALFWLAGRTTRLYGPGATIAAFLAGGLAGGVVHLAMSQEAAVGASGGVLSLLGLLAVGWLRARGLLADSLRRRLLLEMGAVIGVQLVFDQFVPQVAAAAHAGGLAMGLLLGAFWPLGARKAAERAEAEAAAPPQRTVGGSSV